MQSLARIGLAALVTLQALTPAWAEDATARTVVATVNGTEITIGHLIELRESLPPQYLELPDDVLFNGLLDQIIQQTALSQRKEANVALRDELAMANQRRSYLAGVELNAVAEGAVTDEALQALYAQKYANAAPATEYNAAHILVATEDEAKALRAELDAGADFSALAREKSTGPSGPNGGDLGWFGLGMMVKPFEEAVVALKPGDIGGPIQTEFGWHVILLKETRQAEAPKLDDVRDELVGELRQAAVEKHVAEVSAAASVTRATEGIDPAIVKNSALIDN